MAFKKIQRLFTPEIGFSLIAFSVHFFLEFNNLMLNLDEINMWDESIYINSGRLVLEGQLTHFAWSPSLSLFYALTYLPFIKSPYWFVQSASLGRALLFALMWLSAYQVARQISRDQSPLVMAGFLFVFPVFPEILRNPSDSLFAALAGLALVRFLKFNNSGEVYDLGWASAFLGFAALTRNDGLILYTVFVFLFIISVVIKKNKFKWRFFPIIGLPFLFLVFGYILLYGFMTGEFVLGSVQRSYVAFRQGQTVAYQGLEPCDLKFIECASRETDLLYGDPQENNYSILRAIRRNPDAYLHRLRAILDQLPGLFIRAYGKRTVFLFFFLILLGTIRLVLERQFWLLAILFAWMSYLAIYFLTFFRYGYLQIPFPVLYALGVLGVSWFAEEINKEKHRFFWGIVLAILTLGGFIWDVRALYFATFLLLAVLLATSLYNRQSIPIRMQVVFSILLMWIAGLIVHGKYDPPVHYTVGDNAKEEAIRVMQDQLPSGANVVAGAPGGVWAARMQFRDVSAEEFQADTSKELLEIFRQENVIAVYVDHYLSNYNDQVWAMIEPEIGKGYETLYVGREGSIRVLLISQPVNP
jgi:hypothetical protein